MTSYPPAPEEIDECERRAADLEPLIDSLPPGPRRYNALLEAQYLLGIAELFREHLAAWDAAGDLRAAE